MDWVRRVWRMSLGLAGGCLLAGCLASTGFDPSANSQTGGTGSNQASIPPSATSDALRLYYSRLQNDLLAQDLDCQPESINLKATTTEKLGFVGREEGIAVAAVVLLEPVA